MPELNRSRGGSHKRAVLEDSGRWRLDEDVREMSQQSGGCLGREPQALEWQGQGPEVVWVCCAHGMAGVVS